MSVFPEQESLASVYHPDDSDTTKTATYPATADFTIKMNIIRRNEDTIALLGQEIGEFVANVNGGYTDSENIIKGDKIVWESGTYIVVNAPRYNELFDAYKVILRRQV